ncbi:MAG: biopolymer transporter ExbD [Myxococcota bacterium]|nr:biopolymer transporter ExbD [Myxococcota bacterium]
MGMNVGDKKGGPMGDINVTPLVDVVLVLLIIFMVVTPMLTSGVDVKLPRAATTQSSQDHGQHLVISVRDDGVVFVDTRQTNNENLEEDINAELRKDAARSLLIKGDKGLTWKQVREVMDNIPEERRGTLLLATEKIKE